MKLHPSLFPCFLLSMSVNFLQLIISAVINFYHNNEKRLNIYGAPGSFSDRRTKADVRHIH